MFADVIKSGKIGIPFFILEDGTKTFNITEYISDERSDSAQLGNSCSIDGKGNC